MTQEHDALRDLIAPVALGAADPQEIARVEAHAAECAVCREELASLRSAAGVLAVAVPQREPSPDLKASLMKTVRAEAAERADAADAAAGPERPTARARRSPFGWLRLHPWPVVAVVASLAAALLVWNVALQAGSDGSKATTIAITGTADAPGVTGNIVYVPDEDTAVVKLSRLPQLDPEDAYQLWVIRDGVPRSAGLFESTGPSEAQTVATGLEGADALAVTAQPRTSRMTPQPPILIQASL